MLYTFADASYDLRSFEQYAQVASSSDAFLFWQDGVWALFKYASVLADCNAELYVLQQDLEARNLCLTQLAPNLSVEALSLADWVVLTERYTPQFTR
ncbi:hypothetical protein FHQ26_07615 [Testudinibacter sp. TR-2022]|uniref:DsrH/TusB family sulfur relay protein n=1 Tax=Testudinibacter sp. TR-2022 TaxID=2585029 RepID=UPI0011183EED|nr:DsrH/TusB family sulfur metabolism protein [Testudinibacter sp. TR-2022]TNH05101.1 hypothetical protein FHQ22_02400 [Pasteurellaceae bacterium Phil31]TNH08955.1 hypothetical protein FHQ26_07615 [Testudinibacter sp. TR-2022]TNH10632.1 hypothetical protein FHQ25_04610 [Testudinibacter sp. TR-2022]TNH17174.1 hypothetical protein FIA56_00265 [Testudinibacter sp. TR-2022]TNH20736.1 hypothetical protein FHQ23_00485 [Testudinibacter sp. TR-2022]